MQQSRKMADHGAMQTALRMAIIRMAAQLVKVDPAGATSFISKLRRQNIRSIIHEVEDAALRTEIDELDNVLGRIAGAKSNELAALERSLNGNISPYRPEKSTSPVTRR
jgi:hypothetical protein